MRYDNYDFLYSFVDRGQAEVGSNDATDIAFLLAFAVFERVLYSSPSDLKNGILIPKLVL